jgi:membrane protein
LLRGRLLSFGMVFGIGFLVLVSAAAERCTGCTRQVVGADVRRLVGAGERCRPRLGFAVVTAGFALIYKVVPRSGSSGATCGSARR